MTWGPVYEVLYLADPAVTDELADWLDASLDEVRLQAGVLDAGRRSSGAGDGPARRGLWVLFDDETALARFLDCTAAALEVRATERFGDALVAEQRVLRESDPDEIPARSNPDCLNCGTRLNGQYCGQCGQRAGSRLISLWELVRDAFGDLFELDSRLWRTLLPLIRRPGLLTSDYLTGRRARYMPPFRMYLVLSLVFFVVAFFDPGELLGVLSEPAAETGAPAAGDAPENETKSRSGPVITIDGEELEDCAAEQFRMDGVPPFIAKRLTPERLSAACEKVRADGRSFGRNVLDYVPAALIVLLPVMAFALVLLYPLSRRYYVEHLLFFVHFHAFFFLMLTLQILFGRLVAWLGLPSWIAVLAIVITSFYIPVYLYLAMRRVYGQGRFITFAKYLALCASYLVGFAVMMLGVVLIAAFSM